jgi:mannose-1-phosphate guanylyltransferase/phosphomannomutase
VKLTIPGREIQPQVRVGENVALDPDASVQGPVLIGDHSQIDRGATLAPFTVIGAGCLVQAGASVKRSVLWDRVFVGRHAALRGAVLCSRVQVQAHAGVYEGAVVGSDSVIRERGTLKPEVKLWPHKLVEMGTTVSESLVWGTRTRKTVFGAEGVTGLVNVELTPEFAARVACVFGSTVSDGLVAVSSDPFPATGMLAQAVVSGLQSAGAKVFLLGRGTLPMHRFAVRFLGCAGGVHVQFSTREVDKATLVFTNQDGGNISRARERKIENLLAREDFARAHPGRVSEARSVSAIGEAYLAHLLRQVNRDRVREAGFRFLLAYDEEGPAEIVSSLTRELELRVENVGAARPGSTQPRNWHDYQRELPLLARTVVERQADGGAILDANGEHLILIDDRGRIIQDDLLTALIALYTFKTRGGPVIVPVNTSQAVEALAARYRGRVVRAKATPREFVEAVLKQDVSQFFLRFDALAALLRILSLLAEEKTTLSRLVDEIPDMYLAKKEIPVSWQAKGRVIRKLIENERPRELELTDGVKVIHQQGWALVLPDPDKPVCRVFGEGASMEIAEELTQMYADKIHHIINSSE